MKYVTPSTGLTAFNCPHCGVLTTQHWFGAFASQMPKDEMPYVLSPNDERDFSFKDIEDESTRKRLVRLAEKLKKQRPFFYKGDRNLFDATHLYNINFSSCYECSEISVWIHDSLAYPAKGDAPQPNPDLPAEITQDYREASSILHLSPRGAAALLRLAIQKLCKHLGQDGENINTDIKALVAAGLDVRIQKALDAVRVIGNSAVHPGSMDLRDDRATAESLFRLLNLITEKMISEPKHVDEVYANLPPTALAAIAKRDSQ